MRHCRKFFGGWGRSADGDTTVDLSGVGVDDVTVQLLRQLDGCRRLAHARGARDDNQRLVHI